MMAGSRACALVVIAALFGCSLAAAAEQPSAAQMMDDLMYGRGSVGEPFTLTDPTGKQRSDTEFRGKLMIVYFGYSYCPDVCPTDLMAITQALDGLGPAAEGVQPIFVTIDPERDTKLLPEYITVLSVSRGHQTKFEGSPTPTRRST
jgi:cytochrome oxidase Cu insertion factor (SCO1/SenC/PrrC family)